MQTRSSRTPSKRSSNIVEYLFHAITPDNILLFLEEMDGNVETLLNRRLDCDPRQADAMTVIDIWQLRSNLLLQLWEQVLRGLSYLHEHRIAHSGRNE